ncbi:MAG: LicD family protein [Clostridia bacterium]|nr:LicD family protein [Clostridia bacterium]
MILKYLDGKYSKTLYNELFAEYKISDSDLAKLQKVLLEMLVDFRDSCENYGVEFMLAGGTALGAVRHNGFIPWDDDADVMMTRENYEKFAREAMKSLDAKYILADPSDENYYLKFPKLFLKDSVLVEIPLAGTSGYHMIFIDIFIVENVPDNQVLRKGIGLAHTFAHGASTCCIDYLYPSPPMLEKSNISNELKKYYGVRRIIGKVFTTLGGFDFYFDIAVKIASSAKEGKMKGIPSGISYTREVFPKRVFDSITWVDFAGERFPILADYNLYLSNLYGENYMQLPPENNREKHLLYKLSFPESCD